MKKLILLATLLATPSIAAAQEVTGASKAPEATQTAPTAQNAPGAPQWFLQVDQHDLDVIGAALGELQKKIADPVFAKLSGQLSQQDKIKAEAKK